jgi:hypothetical protein
VFTVAYPDEDQGRVMAYEGETVGDDKKARGCLANISEAKLLESLKPQASELRAPNACR